MVQRQGTGSEGASALVYIGRRNGAERARKGRGKGAERPWKGRRKGEERARKGHGKGKQAEE